VERTLHHSELTQNGKSEILHRLGLWPLNGRSLQDALRVFFQPIKSDDARLDFYTTYKKEATEYDTDYVRKYDEDLNTTLIFVRQLIYIFATHLTCYRRPVCSLPSVRPSSSIPTRSLNPIRTNNLQPSFVQSFIPSTSPLSRKTPLFHLPRKPPPARLSPSQGSCTQVS